MDNFKSTLIIGGARSGKSDFAQQLAEASGKAVLFVATAEAIDDEMALRIEKHRKSRPAAWQTLEVPRHPGKEIPQHSENTSLIVIDCITLLVNNILFQDYPGDDNFDAPQAEQAVMSEIKDLIQCLDSVKTDFIIVTNEVGLDLVPGNKLGRVYRDILGKANQALAKRCNEVYLMIAGIPMLIKNTNP